MKSPLLVIASLLLTVQFAAAFASARPSPKVAIRSIPQRHPREMFAAAKSWCLYYGGAKPNAVERLGAHDIVVIDAHALGDEARDIIAGLRAKGCVVIGYLSCFEVASWHRYLDRVNPKWIVKVNGENWVPWGENNAASLGIPEWRKLLVELVKSEVLDYGCDGVFMDTIADLDSGKLPEDQRAIELDGLDKLLSEFRAAYPNIVLIGNWTLQQTLPVVAPYVDAVCWEGFRANRFDPSDPETLKWMQNIVSKLAAESERHPFRVLSLWCDEKPTDDSPALRQRMFEISKEYGYLPYCCEKSYGHDLP